MKRHFAIPLFALLMLAVALGACGGAQNKAPAAATETVAKSDATATAVVPAVPEPTEDIGGITVTSKTLNLYTWSEYVPEDLRLQFGQKYGVTINYDTYASNEELLAKLQAGASGYDVIIPSDYMVTLMSAQHMLEPLDLAKIATFKNVDPKFKNPGYDPGNKFSVPYQWGTVGIAVNTDKVKTRITRYADLWSPEFKNNLVVVDDGREMLGMTLLSLGLDKNTTKPEDLAKAKARLLELMPNIKVFDSDSPKTKLLGGEVTAGLVWNGEAALAHRENPAIAYVLPEEGCGIWYDNLAMPKDPPHKDAAEAFINFALSKQMSALVTRDFPYSNPNQAGLEAFSKMYPLAFKAYMDFPATNPPAEALAKCQPIKDVGDALPLWDKAWTEVKSQGGGN